MNISNPALVPIVARCPYEGSQKSHLNRHMETHNVQKRFSCDHCEFSSNTIGYMKTHYSRQHRGKVFHAPQLGQVPRPPKATPAETKVYRCLSCDYLFGNLSDMKRHLKERHHVLVDNIYRVDTPTLGFQQETTVQADATPQQTNVQVSGYHISTLHLRFVLILYASSSVNWTFTCRVVVSILCET